MHQNLRARAVGPGLPPLSPSQQRLWFLEQLDPGQPLYNSPMPVRIHGRLDLERLESALNRVVARHDVLRMTVETQSKGPVARIAPAVYLPIEVSDLSNVPIAEREAELARRAEAEGVIPFDLEAGPLLRARLFRVNSEDHLLALTIHHIIFDGWSSEIFFNELVELYRGSDLPALPIQYFDVQPPPPLEEAAIERYEKWLDRLRHTQASLDLTPCRRPESGDRRHGARIDSRLPEDLSAKITRACGSLGVTPFMLMSAAFGVTLLHHSGQESLRIGAPFANRETPDAHPLIGLFLNLLVIEVDMSGNPTFAELVARVQESTLSAFEFRHVPFDQLVNDLGEARTTSDHPVVEVMLNFNGNPELVATANEIELQRQWQTVVGARLPLELYTDEIDGRFCLQLLYPKNAFEEERMKDFLLHFERLVEQMVDDPQLEIGAGLLLTEDELEAREAQPLAEPARGEATPWSEADVESSVPERFFQIAERFAERPAVRTDDGAWSYEELAARVRGIAETVLRATGPGAGRVALMIDQDPEMIATVLGVLAAGKAYVPLDPRHPDSRLAAIVKAVEPELLLVAPKYGDRASALSPETPLRTNDAIEVHGTPLPSVEPSDLAYILFTSGTTGEPKGVMQNHRNVLHHIRNYTEGLRVHANDRLAFVSSFAYDSAVQDIFGAVLNGATVCPFDLPSRSIVDLREWIAKLDITVLHCVPTLFRSLVNSSGQDQDFASVRLVVVGGEEARSVDIDAFREHFPENAQFINGLGMTESTTALQWRTGTRGEYLDARVPIGKPVSHTEVELVNADGEPADVFGEIVIRSDYTFLGYWQDPARTAEKLVEGSVPGGAGGIRTGDVGRYRNDGCIEFVGRKDRQFKVRGTRIEAADVEAALTAHPAVREAFAFLRDEELVAFVVPGNESDDTDWLDALRQHAREQLPSSMVPAKLGPIDELPRRPNGKIDENALPDIAGPAREATQEYVAPRSRLERQIAAVWKRALDLEQVGIRDNFFDLGGHSLLALHVFGEIECIVGRSLPLAHFYQNPTVEFLVEQLESTSAKRPTELIACLQPGSKTPLFCFPGIGGHLFAYQGLARALPGDQPVFGLHPPGLDGLQEPCEDVPTLAEMFVREIRRVQPTGPYCLLGYSFGGLVAHEVARQLQEEGEEIGTLIFLDTRAPGWALRRSMFGTARSQWQRLSDVKWRERIAKIVGRIVKSRGAPTPEPHAFLSPGVGGGELSSIIEKVHSASVLAQRSYVPPRGIERAVLLIAEEQPDWQDVFVVDPHLGWRNVIPELERAVLPGSHMEFLHERSVPYIAEAIERELQRVRNQQK